MGFFTVEPAIIRVGVIYTYATHWQNRSNA